MPGHEVWLATIWKVLDEAEVRALCRAGSRLSHKLGEPTF